MIFRFCVSALLFSLVFGQSKLKIIHFPRSLLLRDHSSASEVSAEDFFSLALGLSSSEGKHPIEMVLNPFKLSKSFVLIRINSEHVVNASHVYSLDNQNLDKFEEKIKNLGQKAFLFKSGINGEPEVFGKPEIREKILKSLDRSEESGFEAKIKEMNSIFDSLRGFTDWPIRSVFLFDLNSKPDNDQSAAQRLVSESVALIGQILSHRFGDQFLLAVMEGAESSKPLKRVARQTTTPDDTLNATLHLAHLFAPDFHAAFAATAFTTLLMALAVFAVAVGMWNLDPGKDSIIYRMTSQRIKKDQ